jgi:serine protease Do
MDAILKHGKVVRGYLGVVIQDVTPDLARVFNAPMGKGAVIADVSPNSPAAKAGLQKGDVIEELNGQPVTSANELKLQIALLPPGTVAHLKILRDGQSRDIAVKLGELPEKPAEGEEAETSESGRPMLGISVADLTPDIAHELGLRPDTKGVVVGEVIPGSPAAEAGLQRGDVIQEVNRKPVTSVSEFQKAIREAGKQPVVLLVNRQGTTAYVTVEPD